MKHFLIALSINLLFVGFLLVHPKSDIYYQNQKPLQHISPDSDSYINPPQRDMKRTIGYPAFLDMMQQFRDWYLLTILFNCFLSAWIFYVVHQMIGNNAYFLLVLGGFTCYVPLILSDLIFSAFFITSIWHLKEKRFGMHFILLGAAALIRPSLGYFFLIEPVIMYFYGYRGPILFFGFMIVLGLSSINPARNYINHGQWIQSTILQHNMESELYFAGRQSVPQYFLKAFKYNWLSDHFRYAGAVCHVFINDADDRQASDLMRYLFYAGTIPMMFIWFRFGIRFLQKKINLGDALILAYFVMPSLFGATGARLRLPVEWILLI